MRRLIVLSIAVLSLALPQQVMAQDYQSMLSGLSSMSPATALSTLEEWVAKHPNHAMARFQLARSYIGAKQFGQAEDQLRTCMELSQVGSDLHNNCISALREISESKYAGNYSATKDTAASSQIKAAPSTLSGALSPVSTGASSSVKQYGSLRSTPDSGKTLKNLGSNKAALNAPADKKPNPSTEKQSENH